MRLLLSFATCVVLTLASGCAGSPTPAPPPPRPPNVIIIFTDDQGYEDVGVYGATGFRTPHLDRMAAEGIRLTDFYVAAGVCTPSRAALLTGCYPKRVGLAHRVLFPYSSTGLHPDEITIPELLGPRGYRSICIGKWHLGHHEMFMPLRQGFDEFFGVPYSNDMDGHLYKRRNFQAPPLPFYRGKTVIESGPDQRFLTQRYTEEAVRFIGENRDRPFFLYLAHSMPHRPIHASPPFRNHSELGLYGDVIEEIDASVGQILSTLLRHDIDERTLVIFTSDNGPWRARSSGPLRGKKNSTWEGGQRVPCIARFPGTIPAGQVCHALITAMDFLPTLAAYADVELPANRIIDGKNIATLLEGTASRSPHEAFYFYRDDRLQAVRAGPWKLHVFRPGWKDRSRPPLLFDLEKDVSERNDVAAEHPDVVERLLKLAERAREDLGDAATGREGANVRPVGRLE